MILQSGDALRFLNEFRNRMKELDIHISETEIRNFYNLYIKSDLSVDEFRKKLGNAARKSMERHKNNLVVKKWVKLLLAVYKGNIETFRQLQNSDLYNHLSQEDAENILFNQLGLLKKRIPQLSKITLEQLKSFSLN